MFSHNLKYLRHKYDMDQQTLANKLGRKSVSSISEWEKGKYTPKAGVLADIAHIFNVRLEDLMNVDLEKSDSQGNIDIFPVFNQLNYQNKQDVYRYANSKLELQNNKRIVTGRSTAAGSPIDGDSEDEEARDSIVQRSEIPRGADEVITIAGDSMEPTLNQGSSAFIHYQPVPDTNGQIMVVSILDEGVTCKKVYQEGETIRLVSINDKYSDMIYPSDKVRIIGKIIAK